MIIMYDRETIENKRQEFQVILKELSASQTLLESPEERKRYYQRFNKLYYMGDGKPRFRHYYSDIFSVLSVLDDDPKTDIDTLGQNIAYLAQHYDSKVSDAQNSIDVSEELQKLYDHVSLDIARMNHSKRGDDRLSHEGKIIELKNQVEGSRNQFHTLTNEIKKTKKALDNSQKEYIAILGIFASIVLAFVGGLTFSTSVLNNIQSTSIYKLVLVALVIGLVFITIIYYLFHYVGVLTGRILSANKAPKPLIISYVVIIVLIIIVVLAWYNGVVERRDIKLEKKLQDYETESIVSDDQTYESLETDIGIDSLLVSDPIETN